MSTDYPDTVPARMFVHDAEVRADLAQAFLGQGWPQNEPLLKEMFDLRQRFAGLVGYDDWASYDADVKMIGSGPAIPEFIDQIAERAAEMPSGRDLEVLVERLRRDVPGTRALDATNSAYYERAGTARRSTTTSTARYAHLLPLPVGAAAPLLVTGRLFGLRYDPVPDACAWHEDVAVYEVYRVAAD